MANIKRYHTTTFDDAHSVRLLSSILERHNLIKTAFLEQDKTPNTDGYFTILTEDGTPIKVFIVQIKSTHALPLMKEGINTGKYVYEAELPFFYYIYSGVDSNPAIFFVANLDTDQVFYKYLSDEYLNTIPFENKKYVTIKFVDSEQIVDDRYFYKEMLTIAQEYTRIYSIRKKAGLNDVKKTTITEKTNIESTNTAAYSVGLSFLIPLFKLIIVLFVSGAFLTILEKILRELLELLSKLMAAGPAPIPDYSHEISKYIALLVFAWVIYIIIMYIQFDFYDLHFIDRWGYEKTENDHFVSKFSVGDIIWDNYRILRITEKNGKLHHVGALSLTHKYLVSIYPVKSFYNKDILPSISIERPSIYPKVYSYNTLNKNLLFAIEQHYTGMTLYEYVQSRSNEDDLIFLLKDMLNALISVLGIIADESKTAWQRFLPHNMVITSSNKLYISGYEVIGVFESRKDFFSGSIKDIVSTTLFLLTQGSYTPSDSYLSLDGLHEAITDNNVSKEWSDLLTRLISLDYGDALQGVEYVMHTIGADLETFIYH